MSRLRDVDKVVDHIISQVGNNIVLAAPLGAGKANTLINSIYARAKKDSSLQLTILTALTLQKPQGKSDLEKKFYGPLCQRIFGNYPDLYYEADRVSQTLPDNIKVIEFYFPAGKFKSNGIAQRNYLSTNYTHAARDILNRGVNVICQQVCKGEIDGQEVYSLSCNPDITIDLVEKMREQKKPITIVAQVNQELPFMYGESIVGPEFFDIILDNRDYDFKVFGPPKMGVSDADYMIGIHASTLIKDDGEIQIGIGSLGDALAYSLCLRHQHNSTYQVLLKSLNINANIFPIIKSFGDLLPFKKGLFAATEMFVDCFAGLYAAKILKKKVYDSIIIQRLLNEGKIKEHFNSKILDILYEEKAIHHQLSHSDFQFLKDFGIIKKEIRWKENYLILENGDKILPDLLDEQNRLKIDQEVLGSSLRNGAVAHAGFFLGPKSFYQFLKNLPIPERKLIRMKRISQINQLYGHEEIDRLQRKNGRFINTCMFVTLNGSACSDALESGEQVSGVGGQYNFVAMAHELPDGRSILQLRSTRINDHGKIMSNIVMNYGNCTIPRHLRDIVITEYGIADLRGKTDEEVAISLIQIADSRFQQELIEQAIKANKLTKDYRLPQRFRDNLPTRYQKQLSEFKKNDLFGPFPFGTDLTDEELDIGKTLKYLKAKKRNKLSFIKFILNSLFVGPCPLRYKHLLKRMDLETPKRIKDHLYRKILINGFIEVLN